MGMRPCRFRGVATSEKGMGRGRSTERPEGSHPHCQLLILLIMLNLFLPYICLFDVINHRSMQIWKMLFITYLTCNAWIHIYL